MPIFSSAASPAETETARLAALARYDILDTPPEPAFDRVARLVQMIFKVPTSAVSLIDAQRQWIKASCGMDVSEMPARDTFCSQTIRSDMPLVVQDLTQDSRFRDNPYVVGQLAIRFYAGMPIRTADGHNIGTVCAMDQSPRSFSDTEVQILRELAQIVMDELELRRLASTDGLTGLSTRRAFKEEGDRFVALARRHRTPLSAIAFDIDHFKHVNDTYGHAMGDLVLKSISAIALDTPRDSDLVGRLGGEEFAILLPGADLASALAVAEKLRRTIETSEFAGTEPPLCVTSSFGVTSLDPDIDDLTGLMVKADQALYRAKKNGRNCIVSWHEAS